MKRLEDLGEFTMLSIEDDVFNQELAIATFEETPNINIYQAPNGEEGLELIEKVPVDIVLLDLMMPKKNGLEVLKEIRENPKYDHIPVIVVTSKSEEKTTTYKLGADDFISKPYNPEELKLRVFNHLRIKKFYDLMRTIKDNSTSKDTLSYLKEAVDIIDNSQKQLLNKLGNLAHENGYSSENSSKRLGEYAKLLGHLYGLNSKELENLYYSMSIYDIGLIRIPKEKLDREDTKIFKSHPELGIEILKDIEETTLINMAKKVVLYHHENWDGTGYPYRLQGTEIPIYAQIAGLVDFFDKLTTPRIYTHRIVSAREALDIIKRERGFMFNPELIDIFVNNFNRFEKIKEKFY
jgi:response regulator RpfG family c-di-GMP phosphodiesterase